MSTARHITFDNHAFSVSVVAGVTQLHAVKLEPGIRLAAIVARAPRAIARG